MANPLLPLRPIQTMLGGFVQVYDAADAPEVHNYVEINNCQVLQDPDTPPTVELYVVPETNEIRAVVVRLVNLLALPHAKFAELLAAVGLEVEHVELTPNPAPEGEAHAD